MFPCSMPDTHCNSRRMFTYFNYACELHEIISDGKGNTCINVIFRCVRVTVVAVGEKNNKYQISEYMDEKIQLDVNFLFFISLLIVAQHVSGNHVPIIRS